ncbi:MAG: hypothetical protein ACOYYI_00065 [Chloroflexota bacterium]
MTPKARFLWGLFFILRCFPRLIFGGDDFGVPLPSAVVLIRLLIALGLCCLRGGKGGAFGFFHALYLRFLSTMG